MSRRLLEPSSGQFPGASTDFFSYGFRKSEVGRQMRRFRRCG
jgi:hypothetical protein